jgi:hypothetical protein
MQAVVSVHSNLQGAITYGPYTFPPCIVMTRGESLRAWIRSDTRSFTQVRHDRHSASEDLNVLNVFLLGADVAMNDSQQFPTLCVVSHREIVFC